MKKTVKSGRGLKLFHSTICVLLGLSGIVALNLTLTEYV